MSMGSEGAPTALISPHVEKLLISPSSSEKIMYLHNIARLLPTASDATQAMSYMFAPSSPFLLTAGFAQNEPEVRMCLLLLLEQACLLPDPDVTLSPKERRHLAPVHYKHLITLYPAVSLFLADSLSSIRSRALRVAMHLLVPIIRFIAASTGAATYFNRYLTIRKRRAALRAEKRYKRLDEAEADAVVDATLPSEIADARQAQMTSAEFSRGPGPALWAALVNTVTVASAIIGGGAQALAEMPVPGWPATVAMLQANITNAAPTAAETDAAEAYLRCVANTLADPRGEDLAATEADVTASAFVPTCTLANKVGVDAAMTKPFDWSVWRNSEVGLDEDGVDDDMNAVAAKADAKLRASGGATGYVSDDDNEEGEGDGETAVTASASEIAATPALAARVWASSVVWREGKLSARVFWGSKAAAVSAADAVCLSTLASRALAMKAVAVAATAPTAPVARTAAFALARTLQRLALARPRLAPHAGFAVMALARALHGALGSAHVLVQDCTALLQTLLSHKHTPAVLLAGLRDTLKELGARQSARRTLLQSAGHALPLHYAATHPALHTFLTGLQQRFPAPILAQIALFSLTRASLPHPPPMLQDPDSPLCAVSLDPAMWPSAQPVPVTKQMATFLSKFECEPWMRRRMRGAVSRAVRGGVADVKRGQSEVASGLAITAAAKLLSRVGEAVGSVASGNATGSGDEALLGVHVVARMCRDWEEEEKGDGAGTGMGDGVEEQNKRKADSLMGDDASADAQQSKRRRVSPMLSADTCTALLCEPEEPLSLPALGPLCEWLLALLTAEQQGMIAPPSCGDDVATAISTGTTTTGGTGVDAAGAAQTEGEQGAAAADAAAAAGDAADSSKAAPATTSTAASACDLPFVFPLVAELGTSMSAAPLLSAAGEPTPFAICSVAQHTSQQQDAVPGTPGTPAAATTAGTPATPLATPRTPRTPLLATPAQQQRTQALSPWLPALLAQAPAPFPNYDHAALAALAPLLVGTASKSIPALVSQLPFITPALLTHIHACVAHPDLDMVVPGLLAVRAVLEYHPPARLPCLMMLLDLCVNGTPAIQTNALKFLLGHGLGYLGTNNGQTDAKRPATGAGTGAYGARVFRAAAARLLELVRAEPALEAATDASSAEGSSDATATGGTGAAAGAVDMTPRKPPAPGAGLATPATPAAAPAHGGPTSAQARAQRSSQVTACVRVLLALCSRLPHLFSHIIVLFARGQEAIDLKMQTQGPVAHMPPCRAPSAYNFDADMCEVMCGQLWLQSEALLKATGRHPAILAALAKALRPLPIVEEEEYGEMADGGDAGADGAHVTASGPSATAPGTITATAAGTDGVTDGVGTEMSDAAAQVPSASSSPVSTSSTSTSATGERLRATRAVPLLARCVSVLLPLAEQQPLTPLLPTELLAHTGSLLRAAVDTQVQQLFTPLLELLAAVPAGAAVPAWMQEYVHAVVPVAVSAVGSLSLQDLMRLFPLLLQADDAPFRVLHDMAYLAHHDVSAPATPAAAPAPTPTAAAAATAAALSSVAVLLKRLYATDGSPLPCANLLTFLHVLPPQFGLTSHHTAAAVSLVLKDSSFATVSVLNSVFAQLLQLTEMPKLFFRTLIEAAGIHPGFGVSAGNVLRSCIKFKPWTERLLWDGFVIAVNKVKPHSFPAVCSLPKPKVKELLARLPGIVGPLRDYMVRTGEGGAIAELVGLEKGALRRQRKGR